jgi:hypothetical protein
VFGLFIPLSEAHLRQTLKLWVSHYNRGGPHSALGPGVPDPPANLSVPLPKTRHWFEDFRSVHAQATLGGLHHEYSLTRVTKPAETVRLGLLQITPDARQAVCRTTESASRPGRDRTDRQGRKESAPGAGAAVAGHPSKANHLLRYFRVLFGWGMRSSPGSAEGLSRTARGCALKLS